jgi:plasmid stabilization system protein ParE
VAKVIWTDQAIADVVEIVEWISADKPNAAARVAETLMHAGDSLDQFSGRGRPIPHDRRELIALPSYLIRYRVEDDRVTILEVRHGARRPE